MPPDKLIKIATIIDAHGIKGEVKLRSFSEDPDFFKTNPTLSDATGTKKYHLKITGHVKDTLIARIEGVTDRNSSELLKNIELFVPASTLPEPEEGEFYHSDLIGLEARLENGEKYGTITALHNFGAGDIIEIETPSGSEMLPLEEPWLGEINIEQGYITVSPADYL